MGRAWALAFILVCIHADIWGQLTAGPRHKRLVIPDHMEAVVNTTQLIVDTLIMDTKSRIRFTEPFTRVVVKYAIIGKKCKWIATGEPGGEGRSSGGSLDIEINFKELGRLTIDVRGGIGYSGARGYDGSPGMNGSVGNANGSAGGNGGRGGNGGAGGNVRFQYRSQGESVVFSEEKKNSVVIKVDGGAGGQGGMGGRGGPGGVPTTRRYNADGKEIVEWNGQRGLPGPNGNRGDSGDKGPAGILTIVSMQNQPSGN